MQFPRSTLINQSKILADINSRTYFFTISHITRDANNRIIYGIRLNTGSYLLSKPPGMSDCVQLDNNPPLAPAMLQEICSIITDIELKYSKRPSLERMNNDIFGTLIKLRTRWLKPFNDYTIRVIRL